MDENTQPDQKLITEGTWTNNYGATEFRRVYPPAETISTQWYIGRGIEYEGVNLGEAMTYDTLQVVNRIVMDEKRRKGKTVMSLTLK